MFAKERQDKIYELIQKNNAVTTTQLVGLFHVSIETIRRDLLQMEQQGLLSRVHGGAVAKSDMLPFPDLKKRNMEHGDQKESLSRKAAEFISEGDVIGVDAGSTSTFFVQVLKEQFSELTVITHSSDVFNALSEYKNFSVILCGGHYLKGENAFYGALAQDTLRTLHVPKAFICPSAISLEHGIGDHQKDLYPIQRQLLQSADQVFILADSEKFEKRALYKLANTSSAYTYITDADLPEALLALYQENGIVVCKGER